MTQTNRSFIKAFRQDTAQPTASSVPPALMPEQASAMRATTSVGRESVVRGSHDPALDRRPQLHSTTDKRPLSSFIPQTHRIESAHESARSEILRPGTTVASFDWPAICRTLLQQCGPQLDQVARLMLARAAAGHSLIGVLGLFPRVGSTTTALCLAARAAAGGRRVILVDGNFRRPRVAPWLDAVPTAGWEEVLKHSAPLADAVIHATDDNFDVLALGPRPVKDPQALASGLQAAVTAGVLRHSYDLVLIDLGTFFDPDSQETVLELIGNMGVDAAIAIAGPEPADRRDLATITEYLHPIGCELMGTIENRVAKPQAA